MAGIAMMLGGALANAVAFNGSNYLFSLLRDSDFEEERGTALGSSSSVAPGRSVDLKEQKLISGAVVRFLYQAGELDRGRRRATDPVWSLEVC